MNQFDKPAVKIEPTAWNPHPFYSGVQVVYSHTYEHVRRSSGFATLISHLGVQNISDKRGELNQHARIHARIEHRYPSGKSVSESASFDLDDAAIDEIVAELTKHRRGA